MKKEYLWCVISLLIGVVIFVVAGVNKRITFCDEVYTYMIVNSTNGAYQLAEGQWYDREQVVDMLGHTSNDSLIQMLRNVKADPHPPLYYGLVYIASLVGGNHVSEWVGLSVNMLMYIATMFLFWLIIYRLFGKPLMASVVAVVYAVNVGMLSDAMLIRMYMQLTFFTIAFAYTALLLLENKDRTLNYVLIGIVTAGGFLTQYYFCFFPIAFFIVWLIYNIVKKKYNRIVKYLVGMFAAVAADTIVWHYWIGTLLSNNNSGAIKENALNFSNIFNSMLKGMLPVQLILFQKWYIVCAVMALILLVVTLVSRKVSERYKGIRLYVGTLFAMAFFYSAIVYYLTPSYLMSGRYFYAAAALELLVLAVCVCALVQTYLPEANVIEGIKVSDGKNAIQPVGDVSQKKSIGLSGNVVTGNVEKSSKVVVGKKSIRLARGVVAVCCIMLDAFILAFGYGMDYYTDTSEYDSQKEILEQYADVPWILCGDENWELTANFFDYTIPKKLVRITQNTSYATDVELENEEKFLIVVRTDEDNSEKDIALYYYIGATGNFARSELIMERNGMSYFLAYQVQ